MTKLTKRVFATVALFILTAMTLAAHGKRDTEVIIPPNMKSWQETFNLDRHRKGTYNILVSAKDFGGNTYIEGPYNIKVDPKSDLAVTDIVNPKLNMRVPSNLNIVGSCVDDDGVDYVDIILDGDRKNPLRAEGKEFWSYYLDTNELEEGVHTLEVVGTDINGLPGIPVKTTWILDRRLPATEITNHGMGEIVKGTAQLTGLVEDGNMMKRLQYSTDGGSVWTDIKIAKKKDVANFKIKIDTTKFKDGPGVVWFKGTDMQGSVGYYAYMYLIDNTKPELKIIIPEEGEVQYGMVNVAGRAWDAYPLMRLSWKWGQDEGDFELTPGNPYWSITYDTRADTESSKVFTVTAEDIAGNITTVSRKVGLNQLLNKPFAEIVFPTADTSIKTEDKCYVRGIATDKEGIKAVKYRLDNNDWITEETKGVFNAELADGDEMSAGKHTITVIPIDKQDIEGSPVSVTFMAQGGAPAFKNARIVGGKSAGPFVDGMSLHPEDGATFRIDVSSSVGLADVNAVIYWGGLQKKIDAEHSKVYSFGTSGAVSIPINKDFPKGVVKIAIDAKDSTDRVRNFKAMINVTNTMKVTSKLQGVVFDDSTVDADGSVIVTDDFGVSGYFIGGNAVSAELVPNVNGLTVERSGNQILLKPNGLVGQTGTFKVRVRTDEGLSFLSRELNFMVPDDSEPEITLNDVPPDGVVDLGEGKLFPIVGSIECSSEIGALSYKLFSSECVIKNGAVSAITEPQLVKSGNMDKDSSFYVPVETAELKEGVHFVEVVARSAGGNKATAVVAFKKLPKLETLPNGKKAKPTKPIFVWLDSEMIYCAGIYQGDSSADFTVIDKSELIVGKNNLVAQATVGPKTYKGKFKYMKPDDSITAKIDSVNGLIYMSGVPITLNVGENASLSVSASSNEVIKSIAYEITGPQTPGGSDKSGTVKPDKTFIGDFSFDVPLEGLPARMNDIKITIKSKNSEKVIKGAFSIVRPMEEGNADDQKGIYLGEVGNCYYNKDMNSFVIEGSGAVFDFLSNTHEIDEYELLSNEEGLSTTRGDKNIVLNFDKDGFYHNVQMRVKDIYGATYTSPAVNFTVDSNPPEVVIATPDYKGWVNNQIKISGTAVDPSGVKSGEYSIDQGVTWVPLNLVVTASNNGATFSAVADISYITDGFIPIDIRMRDRAGNVGVTKTAVQKDTTPPVVTKIMPQEEDVINGNNLLAFTAYDSGSFDKAYYVFPRTSVTSGSKTEEVGADNYITTFIGKKGDKPIDENMQFDFVDAAGNHTILSSWDFTIDREKDLPIVQIHSPQEDEVLTKDFNISGVVFDDDGPCKIYYKFDDNDYVCATVDELATSEEGGEEGEGEEGAEAEGEESVGDSDAEPATRKWISREEMSKRSAYSIPIDFSTMTDNEHTIYVYAVDMNGLQGEIVERKVRISTEEPRGEVVNPQIVETVHNVFSILGKASDNNGIEKVLVSLDNGNTYSETVLPPGKKTEDVETEWMYEFDTRAIVNGTNVVFMKVFDNYGIQALYSSILNIDNLNPEIILESPKNDDVTTGPVMLAGYAFDNIGITDLHLTIKSLDGKQVPPDMRETKLKLERIIAKEVDMSMLDNGLYNLELKALDNAGNQTTISRNVVLDKSKPLAVVNTYYPMNGESKQGDFNIYGEVIADKPVVGVSLYIDDQYVMDAELTKTHFYKFALNSEILEEGKHTYHVEAILEDETSIKGRTQTVIYKPIGPYVTVDNFTYGDFAYDRPFLRGHAGYTVSDEDMTLIKDRKTPKEMRDKLLGKKVQRVEISFDNGRTYKQVSHGPKWRYRIENTDIAEGYHFFLVRATMANGEVAIDRTIIQIDHTNPTVRLIAPVAGGHYNQELLFSGLANDNVELSEVKLMLRKGNKNTYGVPGFLQGLYIEGKFWGATLFDVGIGLTFFDNNVKLQFQYGQFTQEQRDIFANNQLRYGGDVFGIKILANIARIPFGSFCGHDWDWLSADIALGANFSYFTESASGVGQFLSAIIAQLEFPKIKWPKAKCWKVMSFFTEFSLWFIPTDVDSSSSSYNIDKVIPQWSEGIRFNVF